MTLRAAIFDLDGTIVETSYDWSKIKAELGTGSVPILTYLSGLQEPERSRKWKILRGYEDEATRGALLKEGIVPFLAFLAKNRIRTALVTNNSRKNVRILLKRFDLKFDCVISRERGLWKPSGAPLIEVLGRLKLRPSECFAVGDSMFDAVAAQDAGIEMVFILNKDRAKFGSTSAQVFESVAELQARVDKLL
jgi:HAD superfamily hydrolase (TIGR01509 family)